jgi:putative DNA primase/helicase
MEQWDSHPWVLNAHDYINLRTGAGHMADPGTYITRVTGSPCAPAGTPHPLWTAFLDRVTTGDKELQGFLQRYVGYCLTGSTDEQVFVFAWGTGANGKSTFINTIAKVFGEYATAAPMSTFVVSQSEQHPTDLAKLVGSRLVVAQENQKGHQWNETRIKQMTGGDTISARFMRSDFFDYIPTFKIFICGNNKPRLANVDPAMRRRLLLIPFTVCIPEDERDPELMGKLVAEHPAILRWCVDGCLAWQREGLNPPSIVRDFTDEYFEDQDVTQQWLDECTTDGGPYAFTTFADLYASWKNWCDARGFKPGSMKAFSDTLSDRGFRRKKSSGSRGFASLTIATTAAAQRSVDR